MTHPTNTGSGPGGPTAAQFDREFLLLADLAKSGGNPEIARLESDLKDAEYERKEAEQRAAAAEAKLETALGERDGLQRHAAAAIEQAGVLNEHIAVLREQLGGAEDYIAALGDALRAAGLPVPVRAEARSSRLAVAA